MVSICSSQVAAYKSLARCILCNITSKLATGVCAQKMPHAELTHSFQYSSLKLGKRSAGKRARTNMILIVWCLLSDFSYVVPFPTIKMMQIQGGAERHFVDYCHERISTINTSNIKVIMFSYHLVDILRAITYFNAKLTLHSHPYSKNTHHLAHPHSVTFHQLNLLNSSSSSSASLHHYSTPHPYPSSSPSPPTHPNPHHQ